VKAAVLKRWAHTDAKFAKRKFALGVLLLRNSVAKVARVKTVFRISSNFQRAFL
jgi:hypothetical protein